MIGSIVLPQVKRAGAPIIYDFGRHLWSGLAVSYRTGDEYDLFVNGWFDYEPTNGSFTIKQRLTNWTTLAYNNSFGNTTRFTNEVGGAAATSGNRLFIDNLTGLMWYLPSNFNSGGAIWETTVNNAEAHSFSGFTDWHLPPLKVWQTIYNYGLTISLNYSPINNGAFQYYSSTTVRNNTTQAYVLLNSTGTIAINNKTVNSNRSNIFVRRWIP